MNVLLKTIKLLIICCLGVCLTSCKEEKNDNPESKSYTFDENGVYTTVSAANKKK